MVGWRHAAVGWLLTAGVAVEHGCGAELSQGEPRAVHAGEEVVTVAGRGPAH